MFSIWRNSINKHLLLEDGAFGCECMTSVLCQLTRLFLLQNYWCNLKCRYIMLMGKKIFEMYKISVLLFVLLFASQMLVRCVLHYCYLDSVMTWQSWNMLFSMLFMLYFMLCFISGHCNAGKAGYILKKNRTRNWKHHRGRTRHSQLYEDDAAFQWGMDETLFLKFIYKLFCLYFTQGTSDYISDFVCRTAYFMLCSSDHSL